MDGRPSLPIFNAEQKGAPANAEVSKLTPEQYRVTQTGGTERPYANEYWDNKEPGLYVDVVSGEPLFASFDKRSRSRSAPICHYVRIIAASQFNPHETGDP